MEIPFDLKWDKTTDAERLVLEIGQKLFCDCQDWDPVFEIELNKRIPDHDPKEMSRAQKFKRDEIKFCPFCGLRIPT